MSWRLLLSDEGGKVRPHVVIQRTQTPERLSCGDRIRGGVLVDKFILDPVEEIEIAGSAQASEQRSTWMSFILRSVFLVNLEDDSRWEKFLETIGLSSDQRAALDTDWMF